MQGLMFRLAELDADSAGLVRVIDYFDALIRHGADASAMMRAGATLADCVVGMEVSRRQSSDRGPRRCDQHGRWSPMPLRPPSSTKNIVIDDVVVGKVWIERLGDPLPLDEMLVDRMALTAAVLLHPRRPLTGSEHTRTVLFPTDESAVTTSCAALGLDPTTDVRILAHNSAANFRTPRGVAGRSAPVTVDDTTFVLMTHVVEVHRTLTHTGVSLPTTVATAHRFVDSARFALSQTANDEPVVDASELGGLILLSPGNTLDFADVPDLVRAAQLFETEAGSELLSTLAVYLRSGTLRSAADRLHLHHSSVSQRLSKLSKQVGFVVDAIENRPRSTAMSMSVRHLRPHDRRTQ